MVTDVAATRESTGVEVRTTRERVLDAAESRAVEVGIARLRVGQVAAAAGVSRQTVYNEFGDKFGLAEALALRIVKRLMRVLQAAMTEQPSLPEAAAAGLTVALRAARAEPLVRLVLDRDDRDDFIALVTTDAGSVLQAAHDQVVEIATRLWPQERPEDVELAADVVVRLAVSHIVCKTEPVEETAKKVARLVEAISVARRYAPQSKPRS